MLKPTIKVKQIIKDGIEETTEDEDQEDENEESSETVDCVRGKGYWKTHSELGPAPLDSAWLALQFASQTELFTTGKTYMDFLVNSAGNNSYLKLAQQYVIAELNVLAGVEIPEEAQIAWNSAGELLLANADDLEFSNDEETTAKDLEEVLKDFNSGDLGSESCDDDVDEEEEEEEEEEENGDGVDCVRGKGYWKTHSELGPAPLDSAWFELENASQTEFFTTDKTYMDFLVSSSGNNAYSKLAQQYIIAELNVFAGVEIPGDVLAAWTSAGELLAANADDQSFSNEEEILSKELREVLNEFNSGDLSVTSCDDDVEDEEEEEEEEEEEDSLTEIMRNTISELFPGAEASSPKDIELCDGTEAIELKINYGDQLIYLIFDTTGEIFLYQYIKISKDDLPDNLEEIIESQYDGFKIKKVFEWTSASGEISYEVEIQDGPTKQTVVMLENGEIICG
jgi:hypothetical protein